MESPPSHAPKKRRFFHDDLDEAIPINPPSPTPTVTPPTPPKSSNPQTPTKQPLPTATAPAQSAFAVQLTAVLAEHLAPHVLRSLEEASAGNIERAVNMYFDGSWSEHVRDIDSPTKVGLMVTAPPNKKPAEPTLNTFIRKTPSTPVETPRKRPLSSPGTTGWKRRYVGSFGVEGWAVGSGTNLIKAHDRLIIERQTPSTLAQKSRSSKPTKAKTAPPRFPLANSKAGGPKQHILVRFSTLQGREIGRLPQETATYVSTLLDQGICAFEGECIYAPDRVRTGDNIVIQLRCFLLRKAFEPLRTPNEDRPAAWEVSETDEERALKLRRLALIQLFTAIGLDPVRSNARQAAKREQLLAAAQIPDPPAPKMARTGSSQSTGSQEDEGDVADDTLNMLYKKAQIYDPDMPSMDPPPSFKFELRKYQKQALCWMVGKEEGGERDVRKQQSLNPLWEEYVFPREEMAQEEEEQADMFYINPYSGEMSLILPTIDSIHKGGILADGKNPSVF
jgi:DNA repair protein RAD5